MSELKALVSTIQPIDGGVPTMTRWICKLLVELNITPILAWYAPWSNNPKLSVPLCKILNNKPKLLYETAFAGYDSYGIGAWLPELEFTHYLPTKIWKDVIGSCQLHLSVSGNPLCATPYTLLKIPFIAWIATPWEADRKNRVSSFGLPRKILDTLVNQQALRRIERRILRSKYGRIISLSNYTSKEFTRISGRCLNDVMLMPIDTSLFCPDNSKTIKMRIGFSGRYCDPRKNIRLLLHSAKLLVNMGHDIQLILVGEKDPKQLTPMIQEFQLQNHAFCYGHKSSDELVPILQSLDIFVIPSFQEGLCISALESMACGVPVISTRCGGPEEYVIPNKTGELIDNSPDSLVNAILQICLNRDKRMRLSDNSSNWVIKNASESKSRSMFTSQLIELAKRTNVQYMLQ